MSGEGPRGMSFIKIIGTFLVSITVLCWFGAIALWTTAIWVHGPDAGRYGGTGGVLAGTGLVSLIVGAILLEE